MKIVIEHLEKLSYWVLLEYQHISRVVGKENLIFTNVKRKKEREKLGELGEVKEESIAQIDSKMIVLDPKADEELKPEDIEEDTLLVIGGICGEFKLTGKTWEKITSKVLKKGAVARNLGKKQLTTDTAAIAAWLIAHGRRLEELKFTDEVEIEIAPGASVELPYGYLIIDNKPLVTPGLIQIFEAEYFGIENFPGAEKMLAGAIALQDGKILALHRREEPIIWEFPSGKVEYGESLLNAMERELREETGLKVKKVLGYAGDFYFVSKGKKARQFNFLVEVEGKVRLSEEHDDFRWVTFEEFIKLRGKGEDEKFLKKLHKKLIFLALQKISKMLSDKRWALIASGNLYLRGLWKEPHDLDIMMEDLKVVEERFPESKRTFFYEDGGKRISVTLFGIKCEFFEYLMIKGKKFVLNKTEKIDLGFPVYLRPLEEELEMYRLMEREKDEEKIKAIEKFRESS